jgi:hypothetical protein
MADVLCIIALPLKMHNAWSAYIATFSFLSVQASIAFSLSARLCISLRASYLFIYTNTCMCAYVCAYLRLLIYTLLSSVIYLHRTFSLYYIIYMFLFMCIP